MLSSICANYRSAAKLVPFARQLQSRFNKCEPCEPGLIPCKLLYDRAGLGWFPDANRRIPLGACLFA